MPFEWKRPAVFGAAFGVGIAITLLTVGGIIYWLSNRPKGLDTKAIKAISSRASQTFDVNDEKKEITRTALRCISCWLIRRGVTTRSPMM